MVNQFRAKWGWAAAWVAVLGSGAVGASESSPWGGLLDVFRFQQAFRSAREELSQLTLGHSVRIEALEQIAGDESATTYRFQQFVDDIPVLGGITIVDASWGRVSNVLVNPPLGAVNTTPTLSSEDALRVASSEIPFAVEGATVSLKILPEEDRSGSRLIYWIEYPSSLDGAGGEMIVDAHSGDLIARMTKIRTLAPVDVYSAKRIGKSFKVNRKMDFLMRMVPASCTIRDLTSQQETTITLDQCSDFLSRDKARKNCQIVDAESGTPVVVNADFCLPQFKNLKPAGGIVTDSAKRAMQNSWKVLEYYLNVHKRDSFDGKGAAAKSLVSVGIAHANAAWVSDMGLMMYGEGDGKSMGDLTLNVDVAGHEMTHGVISRTAKFINRGESGALDEGFADFFGLMIANTGSWVVGKGIFIGAPQKGIRDLANPGAVEHVFLDETGKRVKRPMPKHVSQKFSSFNRTCGEENDRCYVHGNSTIPGHALYRMHQLLGKDRAQKVVYQGMTRYLTESSNFADASAAMKRACASLYAPRICEGVKQAFADVGL